ncbi:hypothetical protein CHS0354_014496 [Potamilus streckersoni]|uniref:Uncharacterized protein n=1 Tax=Potamilus streckersoni TaxID=2493646 RepID=A0AAE0S9Y9_9BIVA|nr:hypothetical protein CHS0354_014496 [Potamilus streckersoni]
MFHMVEMSFLLTVIWLHLYGFANAKYCVPSNDSEYASIQFCQSGTVSSLHVYINGSSILTKESLISKECVCHVVWSGNSNLLVNGFNSCNRCGLDVTFPGFLLSSLTGGSNEWGITAVDDKSFPIAMKINTRIISENIFPEFCLLLRGNGGNDNNITLTCEELKIPMTVSTTRSGENVTSPKTLTTAWSALPISLTEGPSRTEKSITTQQNTDQPTEKMTDKTLLPSLTTSKSASNINEVIIPAAAGGGTGILIILVIIIVACCLRKKKQRAEKSVFMSEVDVPNSIMTDNPAYGNSVNVHNNAVPHNVAQCTGDVYAVVNKEGNSKVLPSAEVHHMKVGDTGDIYALVSKENGQGIPNRENSRGNSSESHAQTRSNENNNALWIAPSTDYIDIAINTTDQSNL